jgi:dTDP-4-amino-4,6-dideoxygalactose transaminase/glycosyltransferase involved in cell wall biosynthesis
MDQSRLGQLPTMTTMSRHADPASGAVGPLLIVAMPALNEQATIRDVIEHIPKSLPGIGSIRIVVVNDGSTDRTAEISTDAGATVLSHATRQGVGAAFQTALKYAIESRADYLATLDSDGQFNPADLAELIDPVVSDEADFSTASRFKDADKVPEMPDVKKWGNRRMSSLVSKLTGQRFYDVSCGMRCYNRKAMLSLNLLGKFTYTQEVFINLAFKHMRIVEIPLVIRGEREFGKSRVASNLFNYAINTSKIIWSSYRDYKPWRFFSMIAAVVLIPAFMIGVFLTVRYFTRDPHSIKPYQWMVTASGGFVVLSVLLYIAGMFGDMLVRHRIYLEELLVHARDASSRGESPTVPVEAASTPAAVSAAAEDTHDESGKRKKFLVFGAPVIEEEEINEVVDSLRSGWIGTGPKVARFEDNFKQFKGGEAHCIAVNSCTSALHLSILCLDLEPGDEVITSAMTFCATVNAILHAGATPVLADIDPKTLNIDPASIEAHITGRTRAIIPVHFAGYPCDMNAISAIADKHNLRIVEDCAHAAEGEYQGVPTGTIGDFGCFSFYATKNITTAEGGMVVCKNEDDAKRVKRLSLHGLSQDAWKRYSDAGYKHYFVNELGFKCNMTDLQASLGIHQLARVNTNWRNRKAVWDRYQSELADLPISMPAQPPATMRHGYHLFPVLLDESRTGISRDEFLSLLQAENIGSGVHYLSIAEHPFYQSLGWKPDAWPNALRVGRQSVSLPISAGMSEGDVTDVVRAVERVLAKTS